MDKKIKEQLKFSALLGSGILVDYELLKSMNQSKTLMIMMCVGGLAFGGFILFLMFMAGSFN
jgi:hypothetical protein